MMHVSYYNNYFFAVSILDDRSTDLFFEEKEAIKYHMPVRIYSNVDKLWLLPIHDIKIFLSTIKEYGFKIQTQKSKNIVDRYKDIIVWKKEQTFLKNYYTKFTPQHEQLKPYMDLMNVLKLDLIPFQSIGGYFVYNSEAALICDPVGLGKSAQALSCSERRMIERETNFNLIICPNTLKRNWKDELEKFTNSSYCIVDGAKGKRKNLYKRAYRYKYMIVNYDVLFNDYAEIQKHILNNDSLKINLLIDEIQYINNRIAKRSKAVKSIADDCEYVIGLSGTLLENSILDLYNNFQVIDESVFGDDSQYFSFIKRYVRVDYFGKVIGYKNSDVIKKRMSPYFIRRLKEDVIDELPARIENNYWIKLTPEHQRIYNNVKQQVVDEIFDMEKKEKIKMASILPLLIYLKQATLSSKLVGYEDNISTKTKELFNVMNDLGKQSKIMLFCHHPLMIELLYDAMQEKNIHCMAMHGNSKQRLFCPVEDRIDKIKEFNTDDYKILLTSDILREGVNVLSANYLINFDLLLNPAKMEQRAGRIDRLGSKHKTINIINMITENTIEENIYNILYTKSNMSREIMDDGRNEARLTIRNIKNMMSIL